MSINRRRWKAIWRLLITVSLISYVCHPWMSLPEWIGKISSTTTSFLEHHPTALVIDHDGHRQASRRQDETMWQDNDNNKFKKECWNVEDICHSTHRWFYDPRSLRQKVPFSLILFDSPKVAGGHPTHVNVTVEDATNSNKINNMPQNCIYSPITNHIVLQSTHNNMLGEFYARTLIYLEYLSSLSSSSSFTTNHDNVSHPNQTRKDDIDIVLQQHTQLYLHVKSFSQHNKLLDSHHLFTDVFRSNPLLSITSLLDYTGCRCMKRLFLCGYHHHPIVLAATGGRGENKTYSFVELLPKGYSGGLEYLERKNPYISRQVREHLRHHTIHQNYYLQQDIASFRDDMIVQHRPGLFTNTSSNKNMSYSPWISEFRIVGLTQRKGRRRWLNLDELLRLCNTVWFNDSDRIVCIEINIENDSVNPVRQIVMHAACDMIIGIHGAQLTEAIWMNDERVVVELLPWTLDGDQRGAWTRTTHQPTPLGVIFSECPMHHIGYPLPRESAPYCLDKTDPDDLKKCWKRFSWDNRDFQVEPNTIRDLITKFVPVFWNGKSDGGNGDTAVITATCKELQQRSGHRVYVLYNVYCKKDTTDNTASVRHFYWFKPRRTIKRNISISTLSVDPK